MRCKEHQRKRCHRFFAQGEPSSVAAAPRHQRNSWLQCQSCKRQAQVRWFGNCGHQISIQPEAKVIMRIGSFATFETDVVPQLYNKIHFKSGYTGQFETTEEVLRKSCLDITVQSKDGLQRAAISINLFLVATGPQHYDYETLEQVSKKPGKISFDFKMAQIVFFHIFPSFVEFNLNQNLSQEIYRYSLKLVTQSLSFQSMYSEQYNNLVQIQQEIDRKETKADHKKILWLNESKVVELQVEVPLNEIASSSIQICLWSEEQERDENKKPHSEYELVCETYINLNQMFNQAINEEQITENGQKVFKLLYKLSNRRLWNHGVNEGYLDGQLNLTLPAYLSQLIVGVRTEKGIQQASSVVNSGQTAVKEIQELQSLGQKLFDICFKLQDQSKMSVTDKHNLRNDQSIAISQIISILKSSEKQSITSFVYKSQQDLFNAQNVFIDLAFKFLQTADQQNESVREDYYVILKLLINRGELHLNQMGFTEATEQTEKKLLKFKTQVGLKYQSFLYSCLEVVLEKLKQKAFADNERSFIENAVANSYFKIPEFREKIILSVQRPEDPQIPEWRSLTQRRTAQDEIRWTEFNDLFDWTKHFYKYLDGEPHYTSNIEKLNLIINNQEWQKRMGKRGVAFFFFIKDWCEHIEKKVVVNGNIPYYQLPGYNNLVKALLLEMKSREVKNYPDSMKIALNSLISNNQLFSIYLVILFNKTNLFDPEQVQFCLEILNSTMQNMIQKKLSLPTTLDQQFFMKGIKLILTQCEHAFSVAKCIWFIYNNYTLFPLDMRKEVCDMIFDNIAYKFFMHWSFNVRTIFHHLLIYRIYHLHQSNKELNEDDLLAKYKQQVMPKKQHSYIDQKSSQRTVISDVIYMKFFRFIQNIDEGRKVSNQAQEDLLVEEKEFHKAMKNKLMMKKIAMRKANESRSDIASQYSSVQIVSDDFEIVEKAGVSNKLQMLEVKGSRGSQQHQINLTVGQLKYLLKGCLEFDELKLKYVKWKSNNWPKTVQSSDEEKLLILEQMKVPEVKLVIPQDEKENSIMKADEW